MECPSFPLMLIHELRLTAFLEVRIVPVAVARQGAGFWQE